VKTPSNSLVARLAVLGVFVFAYFVVYPQDVVAVLAPAEKVVAFLEQILALSNALSPWLYGVIGVAILAWTVARVWGGRLTNTAS
jgi:hypothetical protein